ncbi:MAG: ABC transporter ATP-binding protein [Pseudomonadota bacterium]
MTLPRLQLSGISKAFPGVLANDDVGFAVAPGAIHALLGENGAGKSTLVKMIYGILQPDAGEIQIDGHPVAVPNPRAARALGIGMVFQHFSLFEPMTVLENIALGLDERVPRRRLETRVREVLAAYGLSLDPHRVVSTLSVGERQRIEIVRALLLEPRLLIMDEPTSVLTPQEVEQLFDTLRQLASRGCAILYISHKLHEIRALCQSATILRGGKVVATCDPRTETPASMAALMIGEDLAAVDRRTMDHGAGSDRVRLAVAGLSVAADGPFGTALRGLSFDVPAGEIFGIAGVAGNGQSELLLALSGEVSATVADQIRLDGQAVGLHGITDRRALGLAAVPEERNGHAAIPVLSLAENTLLTARAQGLSANGWLSPGRAARFAGRVIERFGVKATGPQAEAGALSGGNLQKFVMGREILQNPGVLIVNQPTWGVDAGAATAIHRALYDLAAAGSAIVVISQDLDELLTITDAMAVINAGRLSRRLVTAKATVDEIGLLMGGIHGHAPAARSGEAVDAA